jgi:hypothetical protein
MVISNDGDVTHWQYPMVMMENMAMAINGGLKYHNDVVHHT